MTQKSMILKYISKDPVGYTLTIISACSLYYALSNRIDTNKLEDKARIDMVEYRVAELEKEKARIVYQEPKEAVLPQSPRVIKDLMFENIN